MTDRHEATVTITNERGLHLHVAGLVSKRAASYQSEITLINRDIKANAKSIMSLALLAAPKTTKLTLIAVGPDSEQAVNELVEAFADGFGAP
ncbi:MAG: HPr family phosphocarrier protein [Candidatus Poribacteria bacterium]|nr:HPr family phosphocarrier protein [Candidatus Poribacteria bacterium]